MKKLITLLSILFLAQLSFSQTECDLLFEDFESYSSDSGLIEQRPDEWLYFRDNVPDGDILAGNDKFLNIANPRKRGDTTSLSPLIIHKLNIENTGRISYKTNLYQECGIMAWYFLGHFKDSTDNSIFLEIEDFSTFWKINGQKFDLCRFNGGNASWGVMKIIIDFDRQEASFVCNNNVVIPPQPFLVPADSLWGVAYSSHRCGFIDSICITNLDMTTSVNEEIFSDLAISPNPSHNILNIKMSNLQEYTVSLTNLMGEIMLTERPSSNQHTFQMQMYPSGIYFVQLKNILTGSISSRKVLLQ